MRVYAVFDSDDNLVSVMKKGDRSVGIEPEKGQLIEELELEDQFFEVRNSSPDRMESQVRRARRLK